MKNLYSSAACALAMVAALSACATPRTQLARIGPDDYLMVKRTELLSDRSINLKAQVEEEALAYCHAQGKALSVIDSRTVDPDPPAYASATVQFRCVAI